eukprot:gene3048-biopygen4421
MEVGMLYYGDEKVAWILHDQGRRSVASDGEHRVSAAQLAISESAAAAAPGELRPYMGFWEFHLRNPMELRSPRRGPAPAAAPAKARSPRPASTRLSWANEVVGSDVGST